MDATHGQPATDCAKVYVAVVEGTQNRQTVPTT